MEYGLKALRAKFTVTVFFPHAGKDKLNFNTPRLNSMFTWRYSATTRFVKILPTALGTNGDMSKMIVVYTHNDLHIYTVHVVGKHAGLTSMRNLLAQSGTIILSSSFNHRYLVYFYW